MHWNASHPYSAAIETSVGDDLVNTGDAKHWKCAVKNRLNLTVLRCCSKMRPPYLRFGGFAMPHIL